MTASSSIDQLDVGQHAVRCDPPFVEMCRLADLHPAYTLLQVIELIDQDLWDIEAPNQAQRAVFGRINAKTAFHRLRQSINGQQTEFALNAPARVQQWLPSGSHVLLPKLLDDATIAKLVSHCDALLDVRGTQPIRLFEHVGILDSDAISAIASSALAALPEPLSMSSKPAVLKKRTLLRRTFPPSQLPSSFGNANNQFWHQDSNPRFNDAAMLTLWIPLQDGSGTTCPGLQVIDAPVSFFSILHGDSSPNIYPMLKEVFPETQIVTIEASAGDCVIINGLTFHQTSMLPTMTMRRDALLIRVIDAEMAHLFGADDPQRELVALG